MRWDRQAFAIERTHNLCSELSRNEYFARSGGVV
jgi:hypothetical protein